MPVHFNTGPEALRVTEVMVITSGNRTSFNTAAQPRPFNPP